MVIKLVCFFKYLVHICICTITVVSTTVLYTYLYAEAGSVKRIILC